MRVRVPAPLRSATAGQSEVSVEGTSVAEALGQLEQQFPAIRARLLDGEGELRRFVNLYVNGEDIRFLSGLDTSLKSGDEMSIIPAVAGGELSAISRVAILAGPSPPSVILSAAKDHVVIKYVRRRRPPDPSLRSG